MSLVFGAPPWTCVFDVLRRAVGIRSRKSRELAATVQSDVEIEAGGLTPGATAPDFTLPRVGGGSCSLSDFRGRRVLLAFVDPHDRQSRDFVAPLDRLHRSGDLRVLVTIRAAPYEAALWADDVLAAFPVLVQSDTNVSTLYRIPATPCAMTIDERGCIAESVRVHR